MQSSDDSLVYHQGSGTVEERPLMRPSGKRRSWFPPVLWMLASAVFTAGPARGQSAAEVVQPAVEREHYEQLCRRLHLQREDRVISDAAFEQYAADLLTLRDGAQSAAETAGLDRVRQVVSGRGTATPAQLAAWELAVLEAFALAWPEADRLFDTLQRDLEMHLGSVPASSDLPGAMRSLRRETLLHPRQDGALHDESYLGDGMDLIQLLEHMAGSGQIPPLLGSGDAQGLIQPGGPLGGILASYETQLDALLTQTWEAHRLSPLLRKRAQAATTKAGLARIEADDVDRWQSFLNLNRQSANQIGAALAAAVGAGAQAAWHQRVAEAMAPWLHKPEFSDAAWTWMTSHLEGAALAEAEKVYASFVTARSAARKRAIDAIIAARTQSRTMMRPLAGSTTRSTAASPRVQQQLDAKFHELIALEASTRSKLLDLLSDEQRRAMETDLNRRGSRPPR
jgi:hypothetical protein